VLDELGMPWIRVYIPKRNYQNAIFDAIDRYMTTHPGIMEEIGRPEVKQSFPRRTSRGAASVDRGVYPGSIAASCSEIRSSGAGPPEPIAWSRGQSQCW